jgi:Ca2+/Na+ antiporter
MSKRIQSFSWTHPAITIVEVVLLIVLTLCVLGQWSFLFMLIGMTLLVSINVLIFLLMYKMYRNEDSDDYYHPFSCMLNSLVDPCSSRSEQEHIERQEEEFKPFVFKDHPENSEHE